MDQISENEILISRVNDAVISAQYGKITTIGFLNESQVEAISRTVKNSNHISYSFYGGYVNSVRSMVCIAPDTYIIKEHDFPISAVTFSYNKQFKLNHRDFLGAIMSLMIKREAVGDILIDEGIAVVFIKKELSILLTSEITKVGSVGVSGSLGAPNVLPPAFSLDLQTINISSMRLDCIIASLVKTSRSDAVSIISQGNCKINDIECKISRIILTEGDTLVIKSKGKFRIGKKLGLTHGGRTKLEIHKYR